MLFRMAGLCPSLHRVKQKPHQRRMEKPSRSHVENRARVETDAPAGRYGGPLHLIWVDLYCFLIRDVAA